MQGEGQFVKLTEVWFFEIYLYDSFEKEAIGDNFPSVCHT